MEAEKDMQQPVVELELPEQEKTEAAPKRRRPRKKTVVTQPSKQVDEMLKAQFGQDKEHYFVGEDLPTYLM